LLFQLNEQMAAAEHDGFITLICARLHPDGNITLANAGRLHRNHNGAELMLDSGMPLGVIAGSTYTEVSLQLAPGDTLTLLSDGVVEARKPDSELFGFERTPALSAGPAHLIAEAAQNFGQEDDITVLTLRVNAMTIAA
jgi:serine phosphatase RsbU (regulator of sigma subunit)